MNKLSIVLCGLITPFVYILIDLFNRSPVNWYGALTSSILAMLIYSIIYYSNKRNEKKKGETK